MVELFYLLQKKPLGFDAPLKVVPVLLILARPDKEEVLVVTADEIFLVTFTGCNLLIFFEMLF
jgi:hypothetical protein